MRMDAAIRERKTDFSNLLQKGSREASDQTVESLLHSQTLLIVARNCDAASETVWNSVRTSKFFFPALWEQGNSITQQ